MLFVWTLQVFLLYPVKTNLRLSYACVVYEGCLAKHFKAFLQQNFKRVYNSNYFYDLLCCFLGALKSCQAVLYIIEWVIVVLTINGE